MVLAPSSFGLQPWKFVVVSDPALRQKLRGASWNQTQITDASLLVVFARRTAVAPADVEKFVTRILEVRGGPADAMAEYKNMMLGTVNGLSPTENANWSARQVYIALGFFLSAAAMLTIDACPMEGIDATQYDQILGLNAQGYSTVVVATAGYRASDDCLAPQKKVRFALADVIDHR
jgi:nitroreductase